MLLSLYILKQNKKKEKQIKNSEQWWSL